MWSAQLWNIKYEKVSKILGIILVKYISSLGIGSTYICLLNNLHLLLFFTIFLALDSGDTICNNKK